jgi:carbamoyl-phosphate synthase small subunit
MADSRPERAPQPKGATGVVVFADGRTAWGQGFGAKGEAVGELCFNTAMTGYQEVMTDPSYAKQVIAFTFPHIGNVGANDEDIEAVEAHALGCLVRETRHGPSNYRSTQDFAGWMRKWGRIGIAGLDTRALTRLVREEGPPNIAIAHDSAASSTSIELQKMAADWPGLEGMDLAKEVSRLQVERWTGGKWAWGKGYELGGDGEDKPHVVAIDYGSKRNIFRNLCEAGARVTVVPASASFEDIMAHEPDGFFLSNGPGDPAATGDYAIPVIQKAAGHRQAVVRHLPRPPVAGARGRRARRARCSRATEAPTIRSRGWRTGGSRSRA